MMLIDSTMFLAAIFGGLALGLCVGVFCMRFKPKEVAMWRQSPGIPDASSTSSRVGTSEADQEEQEQEQKEQRRRKDLSWDSSEGVGMESCSTARSSSASIKRSDSRKRSRAGESMLQALATRRASQRTMVPVPRGSGGHTWESAVPFRSGGEQHEHERGHVRGAGSRGSSSSSGFGFGGGHSKDSIHLVDEEKASSVITADNDALTPLSSKSGQGSVMQAFFGVLAAGHTCRLHREKRTPQVIEIKLIHEKPQDRALVWMAPKKKGAKKSQHSFKLMHLGEVGVGTQGPNWSTSADPGRCLSLIGQEGLEGGSQPQRVDLEFDTEIERDGLAEGFAIVLKAYRIFLERRTP